ncbi:MULTISPECIES: MoxR family ATPase [Streptomyces]|uniref:AAA family ATPase n=1 Tax=Streptomyces TaxID=1883 RepID=UPI00056B75B7|nr:MoxR family ATPase [Streptomyces exfoliatus]
MSGTVDRATDGTSGDAAGAGGDGGFAVPHWWVFRDTGEHRSPRDEALPKLPPPPTWRRFRPESERGPLTAPVPADGHDTRRRLGRRRGGTMDPKVLHVVNAAIHLRRPLLVTGAPGTGKSTLAHQIASELGLGGVLWWPVVSRTTLRDGLYDYDAIGRVQDAPQPGRRSPAGDGPLPGIGRYLTLGPVGTALLPWQRPRVLLVDELDKSDVDLPNDLLHIFEEGEFRVPELERLAQSQRQVEVATADHDHRVTVTAGRVRCAEFPVVVITSNGERDFPPAFRRRCLEVRMPAPDGQRLAAMVASHFDGALDERTRELVREFVERRGDTADLAVDQLLNTVHMLTNGAAEADGTSWRHLRDALWRNLSSDLSP